jgi:tetratricopeptide (TPR) repeat protein
MALDPYSSCPCGSGKKFKWCCQPIHTEIEKAFEQHNGGQAEAALQTMKAVVAAHEGLPEAHGRLAQLLAVNGKVDEADAALDKAFAINPNYAFGFLLRGQLRLQEGEVVGALSLFRKAAECYGPDAADQLSHVQELIADMELRLNRPLAGYAAMKQAVHLQPGNAELRQTFDSVFSDKSRIPKCARQDYALIAPNPAPPEWAALVEQATTGKFTDAKNAFAKWTEQHPDDKAGWYNLGLVKAWLGDNAGALDALTKYVELETDETKAGAAWAICEVLRCGDGLDADCDYAEHRALFSLRNPEPVMAQLQKWEQSHRLIGLRASPEQGLLTGLVLEASTSLVETAGTPTFAHLASYLLVAGNVLQLWHSNRNKVDKLVAEVQATLGESTPPAQRRSGPIMFPDVVLDAMLFPTQSTTELEASAKVRESAAAYFEDHWIHQPLKSLSGTPPIDAVGHPLLRKKLRGTLQFIQDCANLTSVQLYDFQRLERKLGLREGGAESEGMGDINAMSTAELAKLDATQLSAAQLGDAFRTALKLDAKELAGQFARAAVAGQVAGDRYPYFSHLVRLAQKESLWDDARSVLDEGEKDDCEHNEGRRRNDYELLRGQVLAKSGAAAEAADVFTRLVERAGADLKYLETAAKTMLDAKHVSAKNFAAQGLTQARAQNNRDAEEYFLELERAAGKLG